MKNILKLSCQQGKIDDVKCEKSASYIFFQALLNLSEKWLLVTSKTHVGRILYMKKNL